MTHAYDEIYLDDAMDCLGEAFDYAVHSCGMQADEFHSMFMGSGLSDQFAAGVPAIVSGRSGTELVWDVLDKSGLSHDYPAVRIEYSCSPEYWCGWILAYYQWISGRSFQDIQKQLPAEKILHLYPALHEAPEEKFVHTANKLMQKDSAPSRLQTQRKISGYSQRVLAERSGINLRTLQQYELRTKNINKASAATLLSLSKVLGCRPENLLEFDFNDI